MLCYSLNYILWKPSRQNSKPLTFLHPWHDSPTFTLHITYLICIKFRSGKIHVWTRSLIELQVFIGPSHLPSCVLSLANEDELLNGNHGTMKWLCNNRKLPPAVSNQQSRPTGEDSSSGGSAIYVFAILDHPFPVMTFSTLALPHREASGIQGKR